MPDTPKISFSLEAAEKEKVYEPFVLDLGGGETIILNDPRDLDWKDLATIENPIDFLRLCVSDGDKAKLRKKPIPGWKFNQLITEFQLHYGLGSQGNVAGSRI